MDECQFDAWTKALAAGRTRRAILKGLLGGIGGLATFHHAAARALAARNQPPGTPCTRATECASFRCVDGVCCTSSCTGQCEACNLAGAEGTCTPVVGTPAGNRPACPGSGACAATCDGQHRTGCTFPGSEVVCGEPECVNGWQTTYACGGNGTCHPTTTSCGLFVCNSAGTACLTTCASNADCVGEAFCNEPGVCQGDLGLGETCIGDDTCQSGFCVDSVCCNEACTGVCEACNLPGNAGFCTQEADGATCAGGTCCNGVCTDPPSFQDDLANCGACGHTCAAGELCCGGACVSAESAEHCGGCGIQCPASQICSNGGCCIIPGPGSTIACTEDSDCCGDEPVCCGTCVFLSTDERHCGGCGIECDTAARQICFNGGCCGGAGAACTTDADCCITSCVDGTCESFQ